MDRLENPSPPGCIVCGRDNHPRPWPMTEVEGYPVHRSCEYQLRHALDSIADVRKDGLVWHWKSNGSSPMSDFMALALALGKATEAEVEATEVARAAQTDAFLAEYRRVNTGRPLTGEALLEARAAFGPGTTIVDVITGTETKL